MTPMNLFNLAVPVLLTHLADAFPLPVRVLRVGELYAETADPDWGGLGSEERYRAVWVASLEFLAAEGLVRFSQSRSAAGMFSDVVLTAKGYVALQRQVNVLTGEPAGTRRRVWQWLQDAAKDAAQSAGSEAASVAAGAAVAALLG